jgi:hypothetical protein
MPEFPDDFLDTYAPAARGDALKASLREKTTRVLRWRRRGKQAGIAGLLLLAYAAGLGTMRLAGPLAKPAEIAPQETAQAPRQEVKPDLAAVQQDRPADQERLGSQQPERRADLLRRAGDLYLSEESDPSSALRCYTQSLNAGGQAALAFSDDDTWLVMAIKNARRKEKSNER